MKELLKRLYILQEASNKGRVKKLGRGFDKSYRLSPYNPLSYLAYIIMLIFGLLRFGVSGVSKHIQNPFKWD
jgi:hypothetical protein